MSDILQVENLSKSFDSFKLKNVSFSLPAGYIMGFIGPNGAGKTTTIKSILGMLRIDSGDIRIFGRNIRDGAQSVKQQVGVVMDLPFYVGQWRVWEVEKALAPFYSRWDEGEYRRRLREFDIDGKKKVAELSRGMKIKLMIAVALSHDARLLILDEPTSGLDPAARDELLEILGDYMRDERRGILFSTHITSDLEKIVDYITFIRDGQLQFTGLKDDLLDSYRIVKGGPEDLSPDERAYILGLREHPTGFEGMIRTPDAKHLPGQVLLEPVSLDEIVAYLNREGKHHAQRA
ncbi:MAG: ABC transporter ATP-binding protein [Christensenellales bacterium]|jgi:ABC-2 type transport system ATP-binding protein